MADDKAYSLNWQNHKIHVLQAFDKLFSSNELVDCTLCCQGKKIGAHRMLLSACSAYFRDIFKDVPSPNPIVVITGIEHSVLLDIVNFIYYGEVSVETSNLDLFLKAAQILQISGLTDKKVDEQTPSTSSTVPEKSQPSSRVEEVLLPETSPEQSGFRTETTTKQSKKRTRTESDNQSTEVSEKIQRQNDDSLLESIKTEPSEFVSFDDEDNLLDTPDQEDESKFSAQDVFAVQNSDPGPSERQSLQQDELKQTRTRVTVEPIELRLIEKDHFPYKIPETTLTAKGKRRRTPQKICKVCADYKKYYGINSTIKYTSKYCPKCDVGLCIGPCFEAYHTKLRYWE